MCTLLSTPWPLLMVTCELGKQSATKFFCPCISLRQHFTRSPARSLTHSRAALLGHAANRCASRWTSSAPISRAASLVQRFKRDRVEHHAECIDCSCTCDECWFGVSTTRSTLVTSCMHMYVHVMCEENLPTKHDRPIVHVLRAVRVECVVYCMCVHDELRVSQ